ncbi:MAG TPA: hypothetical protein VLV86_09325 [Vicinamibacterales bacterium]|nr:hypothetical protein [Vicinamibacterales bacterium]
MSVIGKARARSFAVIVLGMLAIGIRPARAQSAGERGFLEGQYTFFPQVAVNDQVQNVTDVLFREEIFVKPVSWLQLAGGIDLRANSHNQVEQQWRLDWDDRSILRPAAAVRRLAATITTKHLSIDIGKQFIRWGIADILNPTDRFAPRDYLNVIDTDLLPVIGGRATVQFGTETFEAVFVPQLTPSRLPLLNQRWTVLPPEAAGLNVIDGGSVFPSGSERGARWRHAGEHLELAVSFFDGFYNLPSIDVQPVDSSTARLVRFYPALRSYGGELSIPTSVVTVKSEASYYTSPDKTNAEYILYVVELERQTGEWMLSGGYIGESVVHSGGTFRFAPDEGVARSVIGRASYTVDPRKSVTFEGAVRQSGDGAYVKAEFSDALSSHWRVTFTGVDIGGNENDFIGEYRRNSNVSMTLRLSF